MPFTGVNVSAMSNLDSQRLQMFTRVNTRASVHRFGVNTLIPGGLSLDCEFVALDGDLRSI